MTYNTPETTSLIFDYLNYRINLKKEKIKKNKKKNNDDNKIELDNVKIGVDEPLFMSQRGGFLRELSLEKQCAIINDKMGGEKDKNGVFGKFRLHNLRKLFKTTCRRNLQHITVNSDKTFDGDVISLFTGHITPNNPLAYVYEAVEDDSHNSHFRKIYQALIPYLSIYPTETKAFKEQEYIKMEEEISSLKEELKLKDIEHQRELDESKRELEIFKNNMGKQLKENSDQLNRIKNKTDKKYIRNKIQQYFRENQRDNILKKSDSDENIIKCLVIEELAYEYALEEGFDESPEAVNRFINKAIVQTNLHPELVEQMIKNGTSHDNELTENRAMNILFNNLCTFLKTHGDIWDMINDEDKFKKVFFKYIRSSNYIISEITDKDFNKISEDVMMEYLG